MELRDCTSLNAFFFLSDFHQQQWRQMFESFDADNDGTIDASELSRALAHYKYGSSPAL